MKFVIKAVAAAAMTAALAGPAMAQMTEEQQMNNAIANRQAVFKLIGLNFGPLGGMLRNPDSFNAETVATSAHRIEALSSMIPEVFVADTTGFDGAPTRALDGIWASKDDFEQKAADLHSAVVALQEAAASGDQGATTAAIGAVGQTCGSCHDSYRAE